MVRLAARVSRRCLILLSCYNRIPEAERPTKDRPVFLIVVNAKRPKICHTSCQPVTSSTWCEPWDPELELVGYAGKQAGLGLSLTKASSGLFQNVPCSLGLVVASTDSSWAIMSDCVLIPCATRYSAAVVTLWVWRESISVDCNRKP